MTFMVSDTEELRGKVVVVTGASRGIGKGIATILANAGATVYVTGRQGSSDKSAIEITAEQINESASGKCIPVICDSGNDEELKNLFERISKEQDGVLDILVNNAFAAVEKMVEFKGKKFYELDVSAWDAVNHVGLRSHYVASCYAAKLMVPRKSGIIINISSVGGIKTLFNAVYGVGKEAVDRMACEMANELKSDGICCFSLWPGAVKTEIMQAVYEKNPHGALARFWDLAEDPTLTGKAILAIAKDDNVMQYTNRVIIVADIANKFGIYDVDGKYPVSMRSLKFLVHVIFPSCSWMVPGFLKVPGFLFTSFFSKF